MNRFLSPTHVKIDHKKNEVILLNGFVFRTILLDGYWYVHVQKGFRCDMASIPMIIKPFFGKQIGLINKAAIVHDCLYSHQFLYDTKDYKKRNVPREVDRSLADAIFYEALRVVGVGIVKSGLIWSAVRIFGQKKWSKK